MRFRVRVEVWMEVPSLEQAQAMSGDVQQAAHAALGSAAVRDERTNALWQGDLSPIDEAARDALAADDLGPGISSAGFTVTKPAEPDPS